MANQRIKEYKDKGTFTVALADESKINNIKKFVENGDLYFPDITVPFLQRFNVYCASELQQSERTITNHLILIRTLFNRAIKEGIVDARYYPFGGDNMKIRIGSGLKIGLTKEEIEKIEDLELTPETAIWHARNIWLFSFYFAGIRIAEVLELKWSDLKDNRLHYMMHKNSKPVTLKIPDKAKILKATSLGKPISIVPIATEMTTQAAAEFLGCSRPHLVKLLEKGEIPFTKVGKHRRIKFEDVAEYKRRMKKEQEDRIIQLMKSDEELNLYDS